MTIDKRSPSTPRVSVLMTIYNAAPFLRASIDSLLAQTFPDWELIAIENGSTDGSPSILEEYADPRLRIVRLSQNIGRTTALRKAFELARGEYVAVLDADDVAHRERLRRQLTFLDQHAEVGLVGSYAHYIDESGKIFAEYRPPTAPSELYDCLAWTNPIVHSSAMYRRTLAAAVGGYPREIIYAQDFGLVLALAERAGIAIIGEFLCQLRVLNTSMTHSNKYRVIVAREVLSLFTRAAELLKLSNQGRRLNRRVRAIYEIKLGIATLTMGSFVVGLRIFLSGLRNDPSAVWRNGLIRRILGVRDPLVDLAQRSEPR